MKIKNLTILVVCGALAACGATKKKPNTDASSVPSGASITYTLPETVGLLTANLTLESCDEAPIARISPVITTVSTPGSGDNVFTLSGPALRSFRKSRDVTIKLHSNGAIKSINSTVADETPAIIGGIIKLASMLFAPVGGDAVALLAANDKSACNTATNDALTARNDIKTKIRKLQNSIHNALDKEKVLKEINALSTQLASIENGPLKITLRRALILKPDAQGGTLAWTDSHFGKWIAKDANGKGIDVSNSRSNRFGLRYCIVEKGEQAGVCGKKEAGKTMITLPRNSTVSGDVDTQIFMREPKRVIVAIAPTAAGQYVSANGQPLKADVVIASKSVFASQYGELTSMPLSVGFGGSKTISLEMNEYGQKTSFGWKSDARGASIVNGLTSIGEAYQQAKSATASPSEVEVMQSEINRLETAQKLNKLEACRLIIESGGYECPD